MKDPVFQTININKMTVKNRIYLPAMHLSMCEDYMVTDSLCDFYAERAKGGAGMICVGYATIDDLSGSKGYIGAHDDAFIPGLARLSGAIKNNGAKAVVQLNHSGRYNHSFLTEGRQPVAPSAIASRLTRETPRELTIPEIKEIIKRFADAALRVRLSGFDAVEILCGTGYLISEFFSPLTNQRTDEYGGSEESRMRFGLEVVSSVRAAVGPDFPVMVRMNGNDFMPGGLGMLPHRNFAKAMNDSGNVNALCINVGWHEARVPQIVASVPRGVYAYLAKGIKEIVNIPVIASHRINDIATARELIADEMCDMVAMGRSLIADPYLPAKALAGKEKEVVHCIACGQGCFDNLFKLKSVECLCNPRAGHEREYFIEKTRAPKKVMVIGGGAAGMSAALAAKEKGHNVTLFDADSKLGGQLYLAAAPPGRAEFAELAKDLATQLYAQDITVRLNTRVTESLIDTEKPDYIILATGALPLTPPIPGREKAHVVQAWDVLLNKVHTGRNVVIIGGGAVGVETSIFLAEKGTLPADAVKFLLVNKAESSDVLYEMAIKGTKNVTLIEMMDSVGKDIGRSTRWGMIQEMKRIGVRTNVQTRALEITDSGVKVEKDGIVEEIIADTVVMAAGAAPYNPFKELLEKKGIPFAVAGDAGKIALAFDAVHQGFLAGRAID